MARGAPKSFAVDLGSATYATAVGQSEAGERYYWLSACLHGLRVIHSGSGTNRPTNDRLWSIDAVRSDPLERCEVKELVRASLNSLHLRRLGVPALVRCALR